MGTGNDAELLRPLDADKAHEVGHVDPVSPPGAGIVDVGEPFQLRRHLGEALELGGGQCPRVGRRNSGRGQHAVLVGFVHRSGQVLIKTLINTWAEGKENGEVACEKTLKIEAVATIPR